MPDNVVDLIMNDHREVETLFARLESEPDQRAGLVPVLTTLLTAHSRAEEAEVYPVAKSEAGETDEVEHSQEEHLEAEQLLAALAAADPESAEFETALAKAKEAIEHHVEEEESKVLPGLRERLTEERLMELGALFIATRTQHLGDQPVVDLRREDMLTQARNAGITGAATMSKSELEKELAARAES
ncbi:MAG TPA: hemerythrin domain-containing protein [Mycobacteriales bacterium]|nr:hemerythrin domain-containing protein [Mycobacteriales bacterium]